MKKFIIYLSLLMTLIVASCSGNIFNPTNFPNLKSTSSPTNSPPLTIGTQLTQENTLSATLPRTIVATKPTSTISVTSSPTLLATAPVAQRDQILVDLLKNNTGCLYNKPCFWGFTPLSSNADQMFYYLLSLAKDRTSGFNFNFVTKQEIQVNIVYDIANGYLNNYNASVKGLNSSTIFNNDWKAFNLDKILNIYGTPDKIKVNLIVPGGNGEGELWIKLIYNYKRFSIEYRTINNIGSLSPACPLIEHWAQSFIWTYGNNFSGSSGYQDLNDAAGLSVNDFSRLMQEIPEKACFEVNKSLFIH